jgi:sarcosine oxidase subunit gamma
MLEAASLRFADTAMVRAAPPQSIFSVSAFHGAKMALDAALDVTLPERPVFITQNGVIYMWSGPSSWLVLGAESAGLMAASPYAAINEQSDGRVIFEISGEKVKSALEKLVPIDLHDDVFPVSFTALTLAGHINVQIWRAAGERYALACLRSFASALYDALTNSCRDFES